MSLWRLELLRMIRTHRWVILVGIYGFFGVLGPVTGRYLNEILGSVAGEITIEMPDPRPLDGIAQFVSNTTQLGLLAVVIVAASALAIDAREEVAAFLRTRVEHARTLVLPRYLAVTLTAVAALVVGTAIAWGLTVALLGGLPVGRLTLGTFLGALYLAFAVAVVAAAGAFVRGMLPTVFVGLGLLLLLPLVGIFPAVQPWLPSHLVTAVVALLDGAAASEYLRAGSVTLVATPALLALAAWRLDRREL
jgi:ABC-2 type transport system permease protein